MNIFSLNKNAIKMVSLVEIHYALNPGLWFFKFNFKRLKKHQIFQIFY